MVAIFILALLLFGPKELPKLGRTIGKAMTEFRRAQSELKTTFNREMQNLERETGIKELTATTFNSNSYNYDQSTYETTYYDSPNNSTDANHTANGASATEGAGKALQIEGAQGSIASGHLDEAHENESAWAPYTPAETAVAENGHSATGAETGQTHG